MLTTTGPPPCTLRHPASSMRAKTVRHPHSRGARTLPDSTATIHLKAPFCWRILTISSQKSWSPVAIFSGERGPPESGGGSDHVGARAASLVEKGCCGRRACSRVTLFAGGDSSVAEVLVKGKPLDRHLNVDRTWSGVSSR